MSEREGEKERDKEGSWVEHTNATCYTFIINRSKRARLGSSQMHHLPAAVLTSQRLRRRAPDVADYHARAPLTQLAWTAGVNLHCSKWRVGLSRRASVWFSWVKRTNAKRYASICIPLTARVWTAHANLHFSQWRVNLPKCVSIRFLLVKRTTAKNVIIIFMDCIGDVISAE